MVVLDLKSRIGMARSSQGDGPEAEHKNVTADDPHTSYHPGEVGSFIALLSTLQSRLFVGDAHQDLSVQVDQIRAQLATDSKRESSSIAAKIDLLIETYQNRLNESSRETAVDFRRVLSLVNESFSCIQAGDERSEERLKYLESNLRQATRIDSLVSMRRHLANMLEFVRNEGRSDLTEKESRMQAMSEQLRQAQLVNMRLRVQLPSRIEALNYMRSLVAATGKADFHVSLFAVDSLSAIRARHGEEVASNILEELGRQHVQPLSSEGRRFCWSASSLVLIWRPKVAGNSAGLLCAVPPTFEHRAFTGTRVATFKVNVRSISTTLLSGLDEVTARLDRFSKETGS